MVGASVGNTKIDIGFPLTSIRLSSPPTAINIKTGAIHFSRGILESLLFHVVGLPQALLFTF